MIPKFPPWSVPCKRRKKWRAMRDAALDVCSRLKLNPNIHGKVIYEAISACVFEEPGLLALAGELLAGSGELSEVSRILRK